jgi:hypothetical protein
LQSGFRCLNLVSRAGFVDSANAFSFGCKSKVRSIVVAVSLKKNCSRADFFGDCFKRFEMNGGHVCYLSLRASRRSVKRASNLKCVDERDEGREN